MQLPRGTFREIQKNQKTTDILAELERTRFSGICSISCRDGITTVVLRAGKCILAEDSTSKGDAALENLQGPVADESVDAAFSTLDDAQIQLSLEFNKAERVLINPHAPSLQKKTVQPAAPPSPRVLAKKTGHEPALHPAPPAEEVPTLVARSPEKTPRHLAGPKSPVSVPPSSLRDRKPPAQKEPETPVKEPEKTEFENDLDTLDSMNLDQVTDKIRDDCKTMVKHLRLDHLMDKD
ncbi:hypothetical protein [Methanoregula sp.]|uniref:hypothetical protein n=1 Tax=Methanoregula sp. TaxID=2052170 RepID=UPI002B9AEA08|nr:hypothetical protein [Methanoregula sp.]HVP97213.1 hypothetical protein [Methanoregula sp.]